MQTQTTEPKDALEVGKQHLNTFAITARLFECFSLGQCPRYVAGLLVDAALDSGISRQRRRLLFIFCRIAFGSNTMRNLTPR